MSKLLQHYLNISDGAWERMSEHDRQACLLVQPIPKANYEVDVHLSQLERHFADLQRDATVFNLEPDFQRGHVWTEAQGVAFVENYLRGSADFRVSFNALGFGAPSRSVGGDIAPGTIECIDGLQRLTAVRRYIVGDMQAFGGRTVRDFEDTTFSTRRLTMKFRVFTFERRADLYRYYLSLNAGGTPHSKAEIARVRGLLAVAETVESGRKPASRKP